MTRDSSGFTLIEVIVAAGLLVAVAVGVAHVFGFTIAQNYIARQQLVMGVLAAAKLDDLSAAIARSLPVSPAQETIVDSGRSYERRWEIAAVPGYGADSVVVSVVVVDPTRHAPDVRLTTIRAVGAP